MTVDGSATSAAWVRQDRLTLTLRHSKLDAGVIFVQMHGEPQTTGRIRA
jgi:hypothetical protein